MTTIDTSKWTPAADLIRVRRMRTRFALSEPTARLIAGLAYPEARQ